MAAVQQGLCESRLQVECELLVLASTLHSTCKSIWLDLLQQQACACCQLAVTGVWSHVPHTAAQQHSRVVRCQRQTTDCTWHMLFMLHTLYLLSLHCALLTLFLAHPPLKGHQRGKPFKRRCRGLSHSCRQQRYYLHSHLCTQECMAVPCWAPLAEGASRQQCRVCLRVQQAALERSKSHCSMHTAAGTLSRTPSVCACRLLVVLVCGGGGQNWPTHGAREATDCSVGMLGHRGGIT
jgi:hypothetical protein